MITFVEMEWELSWQFVIFLIANGALLIAYLLFYLPPFSTSSKDSTPQVDLKVSILVCAKNEADNLRKNVPLWCSQEGVSFEVIVVNDHSNDSSAEVLKAYSKKYKHLKWIESDSPLSSKLGKKHALIQAVRAARGGVLLLTDADCSPISSNWAYAMIRNFENKRVGVVAGFAPVESGSKGLLSQLQYLDSIITALQYFSALGRGVPYMVVGRNTAYRAEAYPLADLIRQMKYPSGDDDLVFQARDRRWQVRGELDPRARVLATGKSTWKAWFHQKRRHFSVVESYSVEKSRFPIIFRVVQIFWIFAFAMVLVASNYSHILLSLLPISGFAVVLIKWRNVLQLRRPIVGVFLEPLRYLVVVSVTISLLFKRPKKW